MKKVILPMLAIALTACGVDPKAQNGAYGCEVFLTSVKGEVTGPIAVAKGEVKAGSLSLAGSERNISYTVEAKDGRLAVALVARSNFGGSSIERNLSFDMDKTFELEAPVLDNEIQSAKLVCKK